MNTPKPLPVGKGLTPDEAKAAVAYGFKAGILTVNRTLADPLPDDLSPDIRRALAAKEAELRERLNGP